MSTLTSYKVGPQSRASEPKVRLVECVVDFSSVTVAENDIIELVETEEGDVVLAMHYEVLTQCTATLGLSVGKAAGTEISTEISVDDAAGTKGVGTATTPQLFDDDTIDCKVLNAAPTAGKVRFTFLIAKMDGSLTDDAV